MSLDLLHVLFTPSGSGELRRALALSGRNEPVVCSFDNLSFGPIDPPDAELRTRWVEKELGYSGWEDVIAQTIPFWSEALAPGRKVAWMSRRSTLEYAGFLEWLWRLGGRAAAMAATLFLERNAVLLKRSAVLAISTSSSK